LVSSGVAFVPSPIVPTLYNWIDAFVTDCCPPTTCPLLAAVTAADVLTEGRTVHPVNKRAISIDVANVIGRILIRPSLRSNHCSTIGAVS
jgi:hypothetical protein